MTTMYLGTRSQIWIQLSCTETRFQKCSHRGKNGSEHPMLSIYMAYNVISCKQIQRNTQKNQNRSRAQKWPKIPKKNFALNRDLFNFLYLVWHILHDTWWILTSRRFRICMAKGGRESARPSYGRPKLTLISRKKKLWPLGFLLHHLRQFFSLKIRVNFGRP